MLKMTSACDCDYLINVGEEYVQHYDNCRTQLMKRTNAEEYKKKYPKNADGSIALQNEYISGLIPDVLYHLALSTENDLPSMFGDVKFVCMGGTEARMKAFSIYIAEVLDLPAPTVNLTAASERYAMYKVGPVLSVSHGVGIPSMTIVLQEVLKMLYHARAKNPVFFRIGTSGGLAIEPGTVVVSKFGLSGLLTKTYDLPVLGKMTSRPSMLDSRLAQELTSMSRSDDGFSTVTAGTMAADDFYLGQARLDGPFCHHTEEEKLVFLQTLRDHGVRNIEMEATAFAALTYQAGVRAAVVCVTFLDRLKGDQVTPAKSELKKYERRPMIIVGRLIKEVLRGLANGI